jgi:hypothetical protein
MKIVIVDDEKLIRKGLITIISVLGDVLKIQFQGAFLPPQSFLPVHPDRLSFIDKRRPI